MKRKLEIIMQHGWAFDSSCWRSWMPHLRDSTEYETIVQTPDRGYFGKKSCGADFSQNQDSVKIVIAHSLGLHLLSVELLARVDLLVLASSFAYFHDGSLLEQKRSAKTVALMQKRLKNEPAELLQDFYRNTYHPLLTSQALLMRDLDRLNISALESDLERLNSSKFDLELLRKIPQLLLVHGSEDLIVPSLHSYNLHESIKGSDLIVFEGAGHSLPLTHAGLLWISLRNTLRVLEKVGRRN